MTDEPNAYSPNREHSDRYPGKEGHPVPSYTFTTIVVSSSVLPPPPEVIIQELAINNHGAIVGHASDRAISGGFFYSGGTFSRIDVPGAHSNVGGGSWASG